ncbi:hypothetical protein M0208_15465 [Sphingomonas sp. SUN019]|uniref:hypothetical protein n=1 Tax=Sphingomonas sp. SUN019 TaxID=2937788 RepID=UPI002164E667|nr:hypothetical protein [Sphingomonas sp. SUN019]UVO51840.1 hypothetical protein M0208_15465 [Sphingomonas sp. SUN019]
MSAAAVLTGLLDGGSVTPIGTCRIYHPLRLHAALDGRFRFDQTGAYGYVHSTGEVVQQARFLSGERAIPADIWPLVSERPHRSPDADARLNSSCYVVEVSSLKDIQYGEWRLKGSRLDRVLDDRELSRTFWRHSAADARGARMEQLRGVASYHALDDFRQDMVRESFVVRQDADDVRRDLDILKAMLPSLLIVTHCDVIGYDGRPIADRRAGIETVRTAVQALGLPLFEPAEVLRRWRQADALPIFGVDTSHYTTPFARDVGRALIGRIAGDTTMPAASRPSDAPVVASAAKRAAFAVALAQRAVAVDRLRPAIRLFAAAVDVPAHRPIAARGLMDLYRTALRRLSGARDDAAIMTAAALVLTLHPDQTSALRATALALERLDRVEEAVVYWERLIEIEPEIDRWRVSAQRARRRLMIAERALSRSRR